jgi:hypothetical protein
MEKIILHATDMGLGTCWLGGSFKRSSFALKAGIAGDEIIPAVASAGYIADKINGSDMLIRASSGSVRRKKHDEIFFSGSMGAMEINFNEGYGRALEMVRLAPSASNRQPWRIVKEDDKDVFHFYLERSPIYKRIIKLLKYEDLQRIDMGIAMCHFECTVTELGLRGLWQTGNNPDVKVPEGWIYTITWEGE